MWGFGAATAAVLQRCGSLTFPQLVSSLPKMLLLAVATAVTASPAPLRGTYETTFFVKQQPDLLVRFNTDIKNTSNVSNCLLEGLSRANVNFTRFRTQTAPLTASTCRTRRCSDCKSRPKAILMVVTSFRRHIADIFFSYSAVAPLPSPSFRHHREGVYAVSRETEADRSLC